MSDNQIPTGLGPDVFTREELDECAAEWALADEINAKHPAVARMIATARAGLEAVAEIARRDAQWEEEAADIRENYPELFKDYEPSATRSGQPSPLPTTFHKDGA